MRKLLIIAFLIFLLLPIQAYSSGWSELVKVQEVQLHPSWVIRVVFDDVIDSSCGATTAQWTDNQNEFFMKSVISGMLAAKMSGNEVMVWVSSCDNGIATVTQTRIQ